ncbi:Holliday junction resolvase RuvX, partial [Acinetobacter baumannii]
MNREEIAAFAEASAGAPRLIGLDLGTKTIGLALSDVGRQIASPLETIRRVK